MKIVMEVTIIVHELCVFIFGDKTVAPFITPMMKTVMVAMPAMRVYVCEFV